MLKRLLSSLTTWPDLKGWRDCALLTLGGAAVLALLAWAGRLGVWQPDFAGWPVRLAMVMLVPSLGEEVLFRGLLVPDKGESRHPALWIAGSTTVFMVWHVVEALTFLPGGRPMFLTGAFLAAANFLGLTCALMRYRSGSLWPAVLFHGLVVFVWQTLLRGPDVRSLMAR